MHAATNYQNCENYQNIVRNLKCTYNIEKQIL